MSQASSYGEPSWMRGHKAQQHQRLSIPVLPSSISYKNSTPALPKVFSPPPTPRSMNQDRLSLRLRSNSGMTGHTNDAALRQYTQYSVYRPTNSFAGSLPDLDSTGSYRTPPPQNNKWTAVDLTACLSFLEFIGKDAFDLAMATPAVVRHMVRYCEERGCEENIEFLMKIQEYNQAVGDMASILSSIATTYTSIAATSPLNLPHMLARPLNSDIKRIANSLLPSLESVFLDSKEHVESELAHKIFPNFVKSQLVRCTAAKLALDTGSGPSRLEYPGLGRSFCIVDASQVHKPVVGASQDFVALTGYSLREIMGQGCSCLQGPVTDPEVVRRMQIAMKDRRECVELILNHRKDGEPFWNLLCLLPLKDALGRVEYWLGAQLDVSECIGNRRDLLRILNAGVDPDTESWEGSTAPSYQSSGAGRERTSRDGRPPAKESKKGPLKRSRSTNSSRAWFPSFRKQEKQQSETSVPRAAKSVAGPVPDVSDAVSMAGSRKGPNSQFTMQRAHPKVQPHIAPTMYAHHILLKCVSGGGFGGEGGSMSIFQKSSASAFTLRRSTTKLVVAHRSDAAAELLGMGGSEIGQAAQAVDILHVLSERARSPSVTKAFKATLRESVDAGEPITLELLLDRTRKRKRSGAGGRPTTTEIEAEDRAAAMADRRNSKSASKFERVLSHWTPLLDANSDVSWVVLILSPAY
ncbi:hypothetical protein BX600DRAFT_1652 [Xylariales sp. PMI_506]|nr:hypothetical protein BX600DRAFT_1652 [Xylariales sp. PMI_506]